MDFSGAEGNRLFFFTAVKPDDFRVNAAFSKDGREPRRWDSALLLDNLNPLLVGRSLQANTDGGTTSCALRPIVGSSEKENTVSHTGFLKLELNRCVCSFVHSSYRLD